MRHTARPAMIRLLVPVLSLLSMPIPGSSSDVKGNYVAPGFGSESCQTFLQARYNRLDLLYRDWLTGSLTAVTQLTTAPVDRRGTSDIDGLLRSLAQYCLKQPLHTFSRAVASLVTDPYPQRMTHMPLYAPMRHSGGCSLCADSGPEGPCQEVTISPMISHGRIVDEGSRSREERGRA